jgi:uncharacterized protein
MNHVNLIKLSKDDKTIYFNGDNLSFISDGIDVNLNNVSYNTEHHFKTGITTLRILMGDRCNFSCAFCSHAISKGGIDESKQTEYVQKLFETIDELNIDLKKVSLWGGEPFLYFNTMKTLINGFIERYPNIEFDTVTNGSLLTEEKIKFLGSIRNKFLITISHDGIKQSYRDEVKESTVVESLKEISKYSNLGVSFNIVIGSDNYKIKENYDFFQELANKAGLDHVHVSTEMFKDYKGEYKYTDVRAELKKDLKSFYNHRMIFLSLYNDIKDKFETLLSADSVSISKYNCYIEYDDIIDIDLSTQKIRNCMTFDSKQSLSLKEYTSFKADEGKGDSSSDKCSTCSVKFLCRGSCPYMTEEALLEFNCSFIKDYYSAMIEAYFESVGYKVDLP